MPRYIDTNYLDELITRLIKEGRNITRNDYKIINSILFEFPTADVVERKQGKWVEHGTEEGFLIPKYTCSECDYYSGNKKTNFCPNCGADMRERSEDEQIQ